MNRLREKIFSWLLKRQTARTIVMPRWDKVRNVAILYPDGNIPHIIQQLEQEGKEVVLITIPDKKDICSLTERPKSHLCEKLSSRKYDVLIDLTQQPSLTMHYIAMYVKADFKIGRHIRNGIYDMTIDTPPQAAPDYLFEQVLRYINMFTQNA